MFRLASSATSLKSGVGLTSFSASEFGLEVAAVVALGRGSPSPAGIRRRRAGRCRRRAPCRRRSRSARRGRGRRRCGSSRAGSAGQGDEQQARRRRGRAASRAPRQTRIAARTTKAAPTSRYSGRNIAVRPKRKPGHEPGPRSPLRVSLAQRKASIAAGRVSIAGGSLISSPVVWMNGRVDGDREGGEEADPAAELAAAQPPAEGEDDEDRRRPPAAPRRSAPSLREPRRSRRRRRRRATAPPATSRSSRGIPARRSSFPIQRLGERVVGVRVVGRVARPG